MRPPEDGGGVLKGLEDVETAFFASDSGGKFEFVHVGVFHFGVATKVFAQLNEMRGYEESHVGATSEVAEESFSAENGFCGIGSGEEFVEDAEMGFGTGVNCGKHFFTPARFGLKEAVSS